MKICLGHNTNSVEFMYTKVPGYIVDFREFK